MTAAAGTAAALTLSGSPSRTSVSPPASRHPGASAASAPASRPGTSASPSGGATSPSAAPSSASSSPATGSTGGGSLPAHYYRFTNSTGFSIGVPQGTYAGYHRIRLEPVDYPPVQKAADWEFTYYRSGVLVHVLNRNILANAHHAYALYWATPQSDWNTDYRYFQAFAATFRPAAA